MDFLEAEQLHPYKCCLLPPCTLKSDTSEDKVMYDPGCLALSEPALPLSYATANQLNKRDVNVSC